MRGLAAGLPSKNYLQQPHMPHGTCQMPHKHARRTERDCGGCAAESVPPHGLAGRAAVPQSGRHALRRRLRGRALHRPRQGPLAASCGELNPYTPSIPTPPPRVCKFRQGLEMVHISGQAVAKVVPARATTVKQVSSGPSGGCKLRGAMWSDERDEMQR